MDRRAPGEETLIYSPNNFNMFYNALKRDPDRSEGKELSQDGAGFLSEERSHIKRCVFCECVRCLCTLQRGAAEHPDVKPLKKQLYL